MAYENVNTASLKNALQNCKNSLNHSNSDEIISSLSSNFWVSDSKKNLKQALQKLINNNYKELSSKIDDYLKAVEYIEKYQELKSENADIDDEIETKKESLYKEETKYDENNEPYQETVLDQDVQDDIDNLEDNKESNETEMGELVKKIANLI